VILQSFGGSRAAYVSALAAAHASVSVARWIIGDELRRAMQMAETLSKTDPETGYAEVLFAEALSTWRLSEYGEPAEVRDQVIALADKALAALKSGKGFQDVANAHQLMHENKHAGKIAILVGATDVGQGKTTEGPGAIMAEVGA